MSKQAKKKILAPPPIIILGCYLVGAGLQYMFPYMFLPSGWEWISWPIIILGVALLLWSLFMLKQQDTPISPHKTPNVLITSGPYRFSRNPIYIGLLLVYVSMAVYSNALMVALMFPVAVALITKGVIMQEEERLQQAFGKKYQRYKNRVRRWL